MLHIAMIEEVRHMQPSLLGLSVEYIWKYPLIIQTLGISDAFTVCCLHTQPIYRIFQLEGIVHVHY